MTSRHLINQSLLSFKSDPDIVSLVFCALESIHSALGVIANNNMPKQLYKAEIIERILEFSNHEIVDVMSAYDPSYRALLKPNENWEPEERPVCILPDSLNPSMRQDVMSQAMATPDQEAVHKLVPLLVENLGENAGKPVRC